MDDRDKLKNLWGALGPVVIYTIVQELVLVGMTAFAGRTFVWSSPVSMVAGLIPVILLFRPDLRLFNGGARHWDRRDAAALIGAVLLGLVINVVFSLLNFTGNGEGSSVYSAGLPLGILIYGFMSPYIEEVLFRGIVLKGFLQCMNGKTAVLLSALLFGLYHGNLAQGIYGMVMGLVLAAAYLKNRELYLPYAMHAAVNILIFTLSATGLYEKLVTLPLFH